MPKNFLPWQYIQTLDGKESLDSLQEIMDEDDPNAWDRFNGALTQEEADEIVSQYRFSPRHFFREKYESAKLAGFIAELYKKGGDELVHQFYALDSEDAFTEFLVEVLMSYHEE